jgi:hypothetical protein
MNNIYSNYLQHVGIKGMKWGVRRYQNADGTLTPAGKKRYAKEQYRKSKNEAFDEYEKTIAKIEKPYKKGSVLSDKDFNREQAAEKLYREKVEKAKAEYKQVKSSIKSGERVVKSKMSKPVKALATTAGVVAGVAVADRALGVLTGMTLDFGKTMFTGSTGGFTEAGVAGQYDPLKNIIKNAIKRN